MSTSTISRSVDGSPERTGVVGQRLPRVDALGKVTGRAIYAADVDRPSLLHAALRGIPAPHARILKIDATLALAVPGVARVLTADDLPIAERDPASRARCPLAWREVVFAGQPVVAVLAESADLARHAAGLVTIDWEPLPAVLDPLAALHPEAPPVRLGSVVADRSEDESHLGGGAAGAALEVQATANLGMRLEFKRGSLDDGWQASDVIIERTYRTSSLHQAYLEPQAAVAEYDQAGQLTIWSGSQGQFRVRADLAAMLGIAETRIRVVNTEVGGGFGGKSFFIQPLVAALAVAARRPVKLVLSRSEDIAGAIPAPGAVITMKTGCRRDGTVTAIESTVTYDAGAFPGAPLRAGPILAGGNYRFQAYRLVGQEALTNKTGVGAYRAPGAPDAAFALESNMAAMADAIGMDPIEFRLRNVVREGDRMPHGVVLGPVGSEAALRAVQQSPLWRRRGQRAGRGIGIAQGGWLGGTQPAAAIVKLNNDATFTVVIGANDIAGTNTGLLQIAAQVLGVGPDRVHIVTADTDSAPYAGASNGSKITYTVGKAVQLASEDAVRQILAIAAAELERDPGEIFYDGDRVWDRADSSRTLTLEKVADLSTNFGGRYQPVVGRGTSNEATLAPSFTCQAVELEVDVETGIVTLLDAVVAQDVGRAINPLAVEGQMQGGVAQGLGMALWEGIVHDADTGQVLNASFLDYRLPTPADVPAIETEIVEVPCPTGPYGARLVGEPSIIPTAAAVADAIYNAVGVRLTALPLTPERILRALATSRTPGVDLR